MLSIIWLILLQELLRVKFKDIRSLYFEQFKFLIEGPQCEVSLIKLLSFSKSASTIGLPDSTKQECPQDTDFTQANSNVIFLLVPRILLALIQLTSSFGCLQLQQTKKELKSSM